MSLADRVLEELNARRPGNAERLSDETLALCAVLEREGIRVTRYRRGYAEGAEPQGSVRPRGYVEAVE